jgi:hypothetical protein
MKSVPPPSPPVANSSNKQSVAASNRHCYRTGRSPTPNEATPMTTRQTHIYRLDIGHGTSDTLPPRQTNAQQNGTAYIWHSTTQELLPILPPDHPDYRENSDCLLAAIRRWNGEAK